MPKPNAAIPQPLYVLYSLGQSTQRAIEALAADSPFWVDADLADLLTLAEGLKNWHDQEASRVLTELQSHWTKTNSIPFADTAKWLSRHADQPEMVMECLGVVPPAGLIIDQLMPQTGSQKQVFRATWEAAGRSVVAKRILKDVDRILGRETQTHPLSLQHPNIIETHPMRNKLNEVFLVEELLESVLFDDWEPSGLQEGALLLLNMADALAYLHDSLTVVHGDVKPDNIGKHHGRFILLDFGICRRIDEMIQSDPTGSLRTRAPEILINDAERSPTASDVWSLGAVLFRAFEGRFPLLNRDDVVPRVSDPDRREQFERELQRRATEEWSDRIKFAGTPKEFRPLLGPALARMPEARPSAHELRTAVLARLSPSLPSSAIHLSPVGPDEELTQYESWFALEYPMPHPVRERMKSRLDSLASFPNESIALRARGLKSKVD